MSTDIVITNSLIKSFKGCQQQTKYKHVDLIGPKLSRSKPLKRGNWFHELLEAKYKGESVTAAHKMNISKFNKLFDEEKEILGDLPHEMAALYKSYQWYYRADDSWTVHEVEIKLEAELPNGMQGQGKADLLIEDEYGLWVVDHKTHKRLPNFEYRLLDYQSAYYIWLFRQCGIPVRGFIWNYIVPTAPHPIKFNKNGQLSKRQPAVMDYPTANRGLTDFQRRNPEVQAILSNLESIRYNRDVPQISPIFRRDLMEKSDDMVMSIMTDISRTADRYERFVRDLEADPDTPIERAVNHNCQWCAYKSLCVSELAGLDSEGVRRREYTSHDPYEYYEASGPM